MSSGASMFGHRNYKYKFQKDENFYRSRLELIIAKSKDNDWSTT